MPDAGEGKEGVQQHFKNSCHFSRKGKAKLKDLTLKAKVKNLGLKAQD
jgi:hypothetical protein